MKMYIKGQSATVNFDVSSNPLCISPALLESVKNKSEEGSWAQEVYVKSWALHPLCHDIILKILGNAQLQRLYAGNCYSDQHCFHRLLGKYPPWEPNFGCVRYMWMWCRVNPGIYFQLLCPGYFYPPGKHLLWNSGHFHRQGAAISLPHTGRNEKLPVLSHTSTGAV